MKYCPQCGANLNGSLHGDAGTWCPECRDVVQPEYFNVPAGLILVAGCIATIIFGIIRLWG